MATENKMGVMPLNRLLISMSVPMMISMLVQALYNIVDSMFVAQLSENALTAVSLAFPAQNLMIAVATGTGVGVNAALSRNLGEKNFDRANRIADHALYLAAMSVSCSPPERRSTPCTPRASAPSSISSWIRS